MRSELSSILSIAHMLLTIAATIFASLRFVHILQLESYQGKMYFKWTCRHFLSDSLSFLLIGIIILSLELGWVSFNSTIPNLAQVIAYIAAWLYIVLLVLMGFLWTRKKAKKPLVYTARVKRLLVAVGIVTAAFYYLLFIDFNTSKWGGFLLSRILHYLPGMMIPFTVLLAYLLTYPIENLIKRFYFNQAKKKLLSRKDLIRIGVTGSYGKTSTKFILGTLLSEKYNPLVTPSSFNTPMGITKVVREQLTPAHNVFVAEMGARYVGDIAELCKLVSPKIGILTSIGKQHLETFGSLENVIKTKYKLIESLPEDGMAFFNAENSICRELYEESACKQKFLYGFSDSKDVCLRATDITTDNTGSSFTIVAEGEAVRCTTRLLGKHNILNIAGAAVVAYKLGISLNDISRAIAKLHPVEHRLELISGPVTVIDDAFNSNPEGSRMALEVLADFPGRKLVVTPGMVELGAEEAALNTEFGKTLAKTANIAILVGKKRSQPIIKGMVGEGFNEENIIVVNTLDEASERLATLTKTGDVVLFENDLPDNYSE